MAKMNEIVNKAKARRAEILKDFENSGEKSYRKYALMKGDMTVVRYWQILRKAKKETEVIE